MAQLKLRHFDFRDFLNLIYPTKARQTNHSLAMAQKINAILTDITQLHVDAIVNAANSSLMGGGGVDGAIHRAGGSAILEECLKIVEKQGGCATGEAVITKGGNLPATYIIHTVGPIWQGGSNQEEKFLANCYRNSLNLAIENRCKTVAFPNISTGIFGFPKPLAAKIAVKTVREFVAKHSEIEQVIFACFDQENLELIQKEIDQ